MKTTLPKTIVAIMLTFKLILNLNDNWETYKKNNSYGIREVEIREVEKMLSCMDPKKGYSVYMCVNCGKTKKLSHSCKSRICSVCGKKHADEWAEKINKEMYTVPYRHIILTVSDRLWVYFEGNSNMQKLMLDTAAKVMKDIVRNFNSKRVKADAGIIMVLHPFGRDLKTKQAARYMARYVRHPAIADSRIINYDTKNVIFVYDKEGKTFTVVMGKYGFIHNVIKHILEKNFKMVRYFGIHARRAKKSIREVMEKLGLVVKYLIKPFSWRKNIKQYTGKDPLKCRDCNGEMLLYKVVYQNKKGEIREYGGIEIFSKKITARSNVICEKEEELPETSTTKGTEAEHSQLCLC